MNTDTITTEAVPGSFTNTGFFQPGMYRKNEQSLISLQFTH